MSSVTPQQPTKRNKRSRKPAAPVAGESQVTTTVTDSQSETRPISTPNKPSRRKRNAQRQQQSHDLDPNAVNTAVSPLTPPRTNGHAELIGSDVHISPIGAASQSGGGGKSRNHNGPQHVSRTPGNTTPKPRKSRSPQPEPSTAMTPAKAVQIYAGPTFHASPAASSLPVPKFFSKSMPQVNDKEASLQALMQDDISEESAEESPSLRSSTPAEQLKTREESPLDIFFHADRAEKARKQFQMSNSVINTPNDRFRAASASPARMSTQRGPHPQADPSIFPIEMDGESGRHTPLVAGTPPPKPYQHNNYFEGTGSMRADKAKSDALKQLLFARAQDAGTPGSLSPSPSPSPSTQSTALGSPNIRSRSSSPYNAVFGNNLNDSRPVSARPYSSHLRQEVRPENLPELAGNQPSTPTPSKSRNFLNPDSSHASLGSQNALNSNTPPAIFQSQDAFRASLGNNVVHDHSSTEVMENKIRQILKLDNFPSLGVR